MVPGCWGTHMASLRDRQNMEMLGLMRSSGGFSICLKEMSPENSMFRKFMWDIPTLLSPSFSFKQKPDWEIVTLYINSNFRHIKYFESQGHF